MKIRNTVFEKAIAIIFVCLSLLCAVSCSVGIEEADTNIFLNSSVSSSPAENKLYEVNFRMSYEGAYPSALGRNSGSGETRSSVSMGNPLSGYLYYIEAASPGRETVVVESDQITDNLTFKLMLGIASWNVKAYLKNGSEKIEVGSVIVNVSENNPVPEAVISIIPRTEGQGKGFVNLSFDNLDPSIASVELYNPEIDFTDWTADRTGIFTRAGQYIAPGIYKVTIFFKNTLGETIYSCRETVNVYAGYTTDSWFGSSSYLEKTEGVDGVRFCITPQLIDSYAQTEIFMKADAAGDESEKSGTQLSPFRTFKAAFNRLEQLNDGTKNYKIIILSNMTLGDSDFISDASGKSYALYNSDKNLDLSIEAAKASGYKITGSPDIRLFNFAPANGKKVNVEIDNLEFTNGGYISIEGGCISINPDGNTVQSSLTLKNVKINGFMAKDGGAIFARKTDIEADGCIFYGNKSNSMGTVYLSDDSSFTLDGNSSISGNSANNYAAGVYVGLSASFLMKSGTIGGTAAYNPLSPDTSMGNFIYSTMGTGCGVYVDDGGKFYMTGGTITGNRNADDAVPTEKLYGNGVFVSSISSDARIGGSSVVTVDNDILLGWKATLGISGSLTCAEKYAARISLCEDNSPVPALRDMTQILDRISDGTVFIHGSGGYSISQTDLNKIAITSTTIEYEQLSGAYRECGYNYCFMKNSGYGIIKRVGVGVIPTLPGEFRFVLNNSISSVGGSGRLSFKVTDNASPMPNELTASSSSISILQGGNELYKVTSSTSTMAYLDLGNTKLKALPLGEYQVRMTAVVGGLMIDDIQNTRFYTVENVRDTIDSLLEGESLTLQMGDVPLAKKLVSGEPTLFNIKTGTTVKLVGDAEKRSTISIDANARNVDFAEISAGATFILENIEITNYDRYALFKITGGTVQLINCKITGIDPNNASGSMFASISDNGSLVMDGGIITGNLKNSAYKKYPFINISKGSFTMKNGAKIENNYLDAEYPCVQVGATSTFIMETGAEINEPGKIAVKVASGGTFNQNGCTVTGTIQ